MSIGIALTTHAKQDDQTGKNCNDKPDKGAAVYSTNKRDKAHKEEKGKKDKKYNKPKEYRDYSCPFVNDSRTTRLAGRSQFQMPVRRLLF